MRIIDDPWNYRAPEQIDKNDPILIVGTGLSMIDTVLTLHHQGHQGKIYAISRHGLVPLPHNDLKSQFQWNEEHIPKDFNDLMKTIRELSQSHLETTGDWRPIVNGLRPHIPAIWKNASISERKRFLRHVASYWNVHRHRVHDKLSDLLIELADKNQFQLLAGRVLSIKDEKTQIKLRHAKEIIEVKVKCVINCMGPLMNMRSAAPPLMQAILNKKFGVLDPLNLGFATASDGQLCEPGGASSSLLYAIGPLTKGVAWECTAVPEIRKQSFQLAKHLLNIN